ncbi:pilus assembly protein TadG-related protein [Streptomyces sp. G45]|uniref:pilus assembly protein TadG-related protein n=1 Tax=Streptomyces sp. G45 TaxID=3406627 RepID=UPI003C142966
MTGGRSWRDDQGQALPLYVWVTAIILFAAFAFFAFGQAASARNGAQSAADAAALAAAQDSRDELLEGLGDAIENGEDGEWVDWLTGKGPLLQGGPQGAAQTLASRNDSKVTGFGPAEVRGYPGWRVQITTNYTVGESIIPGTESYHAKAEATAVIKPRCDVEPSDATEDTSEDIPEDTSGDTPQNGSEDDRDDSADDPPKALVEFTCDDASEPVKIDPEDFELGDLPDASDMFSVHLVK